MKVILSRKGFDSSSGGMPSPIFPDGKIISLPIPAKDSKTKLNDLNFHGYNVGELVSSLSNNKIQSDQGIHLDPDINYQLLSNRLENWKGAFGQAGAAQKHLSNAGVGRGDLFIYFGWFREVEQYNGWKYKRNSPDLHVIYGWLFVEEVLSVYGKEKEILKSYPWLYTHPHLSDVRDKQNTLYTAKETLPFGKNTSGAGVFNEIRDIQILTDRTQNNRSHWELPICFYPKNNNPPLSYHSNKSRWNLGDERVTLRSAGRGQEFVIDTKHYPEICDWLKKLLN